MRRGKNMKSAVVEPGLTLTKASFQHLDFLGVTEAAALCSARWVGKGKRNEADQAACEGMRRTLNELDMCGEICIGEGERDEAPMLYIGEKLGTGEGPKIQIAVDPLEGTNLC